ncbi:MAG TPA: hypothetical protein VN859_01030, partial [Steroidobacteraceae bacterium]|nr:hypothetical protein [Steroidobacteraceae bacterium]
EPQRAALIPGFGDVRGGALAAGAIGCSISGAGPTVFAWSLAEHAGAVCDSMVAAFARHGLDSDHWITALAPVGARILA